MKFINTLSAFSASCSSDAKNLNTFKREKTRREKTSHKLICVFLTWIRKYFTTIPYDANPSLDRFIFNYILWSFIRPTTTKNCSRKHNWSNKQIVCQLKGGVIHTRLVEWICKKPFFMLFPIEFVIRYGIHFFPIFGLKLDHYDFWFFFSIFKWKLWTILHWIPLFFGRRCILPLT